MKGTVFTNPQIGGDWGTTWIAMPFSDIGALRRAALGRKK